jgi:hypothetical protein
MADRIDHKAEADRWLGIAATWFRNEEDTEAPQVAQAAALIAIGHALRDLTGSVEAGGRP